MLGRIPGKKSEEGGRSLPYIEYPKGGKPIKIGHFELRFG